MSVLAIACNDVRRTFLTPLAWILLAVFQVLMTVTFFTLADQYQRDITAYVNHGLTVTVVAGTLQSAGLLLLLITPYLSIRLVSEEHRNGTLALLLSAPVSTSEVVAGKFLGVLSVYVVMLLLAGLLPLSLSLGTRLDFGLYAAGMFGLLLLCCSFAAMGLFTSTLSSQPVAAAVLNFGLVFGFWVIHLLGNTGNVSVDRLIDYLSMQHHLNRLLSGLFSTVDLAYFVLLTLLFLSLGILRLESRRRAG